MKRIVSLALAGAVTLGMLATGVAGANQGNEQGGSQAGERGHGDDFRGWTPCALTTPISGTQVFAHATGGKPGGSVTVEIRVKHPTAGLAFSATVTPTFPTALLGAPVILTRSGTSFVLKGTIPVPSNATAGNATLAVTLGLYGLSGFTCAGLTAKIMVPKPSQSATCAPADLGVWAWATPAMPGGTLWVAVMLKKNAPGATITGSATAAIPGAGAPLVQTLAPLGTWPVMAASFPVAASATLGATATVAITGNYTLANVPTSFTCSLSTPIKLVKFWPSEQGD